MENLKRSKSRNLLHVEVRSLDAAGSEPSGGIGVRVIGINPGSVVRGSSICASWGAKHASVRRRGVAAAFLR